MKKTRDVKTVGVRVYAYRKAPELPVQLSVAPEFLDLSNDVEREVTIEWTLVTKGYRFPDNGTAIVFTSPGSAKTFGDVVVADDGKVENRIAKVVVKNTSGLAYAYTVSVIDDATGLTTSLDPGVQVRPR